jgi:hypothetical protein
MTPSNNIYESSYWCLRTDGNKTPSVKTSNSQESKLYLQYQLLENDEYKTMEINQFLEEYEWLYNN